MKLNPLHNQFFRKLMLSMFLVILGYSENALAQEAGKIMRVTGKATITSNANQSREAAKDEIVNTGDTISSGKESQVLIRSTPRSA